LWPNCLFTGGHFEWRVPIDDENMLSVGWFFERVPNEMEPFTQDRIPYWYSPINEARTGRWITTHVMNQDFVAWVGQGALADRTQEHLGESDRGVIMMRKRMLEQAELVARGGEPGDPRSGAERLRAAPDHRPGVLRRRLLPSEQRQAARTHAGTRPAKRIPLLDRPAGGDPAGLPPRDGPRRRSPARRSLAQLATSNLDHRSGVFGSH
jgi:LigXa C-terminal domain like